MHVKISLFFVFIFFIPVLLADEYVLNESAMYVDARDLALGGLVCSYEPSVKNKLGLTYLMPFQLKELSIRKLDFQKQFVGLDWLFGWSQSGNADMMENTLSMHAGKLLNKKVYLGVEVSALLLDNALDEQVYTCFATLDCTYELSEKVGIGLKLMNPSGSRLRMGMNSIPLSSAAFLGSRYAPTHQCWVFFEVAARLNVSMVGRIGLEYELSEALVLRTGLQTMPTMPSWGIGGTVSRFRYSWGGNLHPILGISNGFTLNYSW